MVWSIRLLESAISTIMHLLDLATGLTHQPLAKPNLYVNPALVYQPVIFIFVPKNYSPLKRFLGSKELVAALKSTLEGLVLKMQRLVRLQPA